MIVTGLGLVSGALRLLQVINSVQTPDPEIANVGLRILNEFIDELRTQDTGALSVLIKQFTLSNGVAAYTIGPGGAFDQAWPEEILGVSVVPNSNAGAQNVQEIPLGRPLMWDEFQGVVQKGVTSSYPTATYYDHAYSSGLGNITVYPVPTSDITALKLYTPNVLGVFADLSTQYDVAPGYAKMLRYNLALPLAAEVEREPSQLVLRLAEKTLGNIKRKNQVFPLGRVDPMMPTVNRGRQFNPWTGTWQ